MGQMVVKYGEFESSATRMKAKNDELLENLNQISTLINSLQGEWESNAAVKIREKITSMQPKFEQYYDVVNNYVLLVRNTAQEYSGSEKVLTDKASQFI